MIHAFGVADQVWVSARRVSAGTRLSPAEQSRAARGVLSDLIATVLPAAAGAPVVSTPAGAPRLAGVPDAYVSLSHDDGWVAAAVGRGRRVGVDVQVPVRGSASRLGGRCLGKHLALLNVLPEDRRDAELAWVWTVQESCVKAEGSGLAGRPWTLDVPPFHHHGRVGGLSWRSLRELVDVPLSCAYRSPGSDVRLPRHG